MEPIQSVQSPSEGLDIINALYAWRAIRKWQFVGKARREFSNVSPQYKAGYPWVTRFTTRVVA